MSESISESRSEISTHLKVGDRVAIKRTNGNIEDDWEIVDVESLPLDGQMQKIAIVSKKVLGEVLQKVLPLEEIETLNPQK